MFCYYFLVINLLNWAVYRFLNSLQCKRANQNIYHLLWPIKWYRNIPCTIEWHIIFSEFIAQASERYVPRRSISSDFASEERVTTATRARATGNSGSYQVTRSSIRPPMFIFFCRLTHGERHMNVFAVLGASSTRTMTMLL